LTRRRRLSFFILICIQIIHRTTTAKRTIKYLINLLNICSVTKNPLCAIATTEFAKDKTLNPLSISIKAKK
jgi:hypothetical protein